MVGLIPIFAALLYPKTDLILTPFGTGAFQGRFVFPPCRRMARVNLLINDLAKSRGQMREILFLERLHGVWKIPMVIFDPAIHGVEPCIDTEDIARQFRRHAHRDRKSTRLNSS